MNYVKYNTLISNEDKLILLCARSRVNHVVSSEIKTLIQQDIDWDYLIDKAGKHKVTPLLYWQLNNLSTDSVPHDIMESLKVYFYQNTHKNLLFLGELLNILDGMKNNNITAIPYKGPILAILAYQNLSLREFVDLDILIQENNALKVKKLLTSRGFELISLPDKINDSFYLKHQREYVFRTKRGVSLEVHWNFQGMFLRFPIDTEFIFEKPITMKVDGKNVISFNIENLILILSIHAALHDWSELSMICDISELVQSKKNIDWNYLIRKSEIMKVKKILQVTLLLARDLLGLEIPSQVMNRRGSSQSDSLAREIESIFYEDSSLSMYRRLLFLFKKRDNLKDGFAEVLRTIFIPTYYDFSDLALPKPLYFLYYIIRPFLLLKRYSWYN